MLIYGLKYIYIFIYIHVYIYICLVRITSGSCHAEYVIDSNMILGKIILGNYVEWYFIFSLIITLFYNYSSYGLFIIVILLDV